MLQRTESGFCASVLIYAFPRAIAIVNKLNNSHVTAHLDFLAAYAYETGGLFLDDKRILPVLGSSGRAICLSPLFQITSDQCAPPFLLLPINLLNYATP